MSYYYYSNGNSTFINIKDMIDNGNSTFTNTDGFPTFPGSKYTLGNDDKCLNDSGFFFKNVDIITNRIANYIDYNLTTTSINIPTNANYLTSILIGAGGGGGSGGPAVNNNGGINNNGAGGGCGGLYNIYMLSKIPLNDNTSNGIGNVTQYNIRIGTGGNGGQPIANDDAVTLINSGLNRGNPGNSGNATFIQLVSSSGNYSATVNGGTGGGGGSRAYTNGTVQGANNGTDCSITFTNNGPRSLSTYKNATSTTNDLNPSKNVVYSNNTYNYNTPASAINPGTAVTAAALSISTNIVNIQSSIFNYNFNTYNSINAYSSGGDGAKGNDAARTITANEGLPGPPGFVRVYYFYN